MDEKLKQLLRDCKKLLSWDADEMIIYFLECGLTDGEWIELSPDWTKDRDELLQQITNVLSCPLQGNDENG